MAVKEDILNELSSKLNLKDINEESKLQDLGIDSLDVVEYLLELEEKFNIEFPPEEMQGLKTIGDLIRIVEDKVSQ